MIFIQKALKKHPAINQVYLEGLCGTRKIETSEKIKQDIYPVTGISGVDHMQIIFKVQR